MDLLGFLEIDPGFSPLHFAPASVRQAGPNQAGPEARPPGDLAGPSLATSPDESRCSKPRAPAAPHPCSEPWPLPSPVAGHSFPGVFRASTVREEIPVFLPHKSRVDSEERGGANGDGGPLDSRALQQLAPEGEEHSLDRRQARSAFSGSIEHDELLSEQEIFGDD